MNKKNYRRWLGRQRAYHNRQRQKKWPADATNAQKERHEGAWRTLNLAIDMFEREDRLIGLYRTVESGVESYFKITQGHDETPR